jgi:hypothetical protein
MVRQFWRERYESRGALLHEFPLFDKARTPRIPGLKCPQRWTDAVLLPDWPEPIELKFRGSLDVPIIRNGEQQRWMQALEGRHTIVIQAKERRLGANVLGQTICSAALVSVWRAQKIEPVALVTECDDQLLGAVRSVPDLAEPEFVRPDWLSDNRIVERHRDVVGTLLWACRHIEVVAVTNLDHPYNHAPERHSVDDEIEDWIVAELPNAAHGTRQSLGYGMPAPLIVNGRGDEDGWAVHSHGRGKSKRSAMTLPLIGHAVLSQSLLRRTGKANLTSVLVAESANGGLVPLLVPFTWLQVAVRSPRPWRGSAAEFPSH